MPAMNMRVAFSYPDPEAGLWLDELRRQLPEAEIEDWTGHDTLGPGRSGRAEHAVAWAPPQAFIDLQPGLKTLFNVGAGVDALQRLALPPGLSVVRLDDAGMAAQMAEYVCHYLLRHVRAFARFEAQQQVGRWYQGPTPVRGDHPVGVMGMGVLGRHVAQAVRQFGFPVNGWSRSPHHMDGVTGFHGMDQLDHFLAASRVLVCLLPLTHDTRDLLDARRLSRLMPGGYLINVARGALVVDEDLLQMIDNGHLAGAALDVFRTEPLPPEHPFWRHPAIRVTPHVSARTLRHESMAQIAGKIRALQRGEPVTGLVDRQRGY